MNKVTYWFGLLKLALIIGITASVLYTLVDIQYVNQVATTGIDPLVSESTWDPFLTISFMILGFTMAGAGVFLIVASIGFVFRSAQWLKGQDDSAIRFKPGWAIAGYIIPVISVIVPFMFQWDLNKGGYHSEESKKQTKTLLILTLVVAVISSAVLRSSLTDLTLFFSSDAPEITLEEFVASEWKSIYGSILDVGGMALFFFAARNIYAGLVKRSQATA